MDMKKIVMAATLLSIVTGGEVSALAAKTQHSVAKITHVKVTKHKVTGYTTAQSHVKLMKLKHGEKVSATANKHGKFTLKVKSNNLTKLKFKLKATKTGLKARTYTHKVKKAVQSIDDGATTETQTAPAVVKPDSASADKKPASNHKEKPLSPEVVMQTMTLQGHFREIKANANARLNNLKNAQSTKRKNPIIIDLMQKKATVASAQAALDKENANSDKTEQTTASLKGALKTAKDEYNAAKTEHQAESDLLDNMDTELKAKTNEAEQVSKVIQQLQDYLDGKSNTLPTLASAS